MDFIRRFASQTPNSPVISTINKFIYILLSKPFSILLILMPVFSLSWIIPTIYVFWMFVGILSVFALTLLAATLHTIPRTVVYESWSVFTSDVLTVISYPSVIAVLSGLIYALSIHITPPPTPSVTKRDIPESHSNTIYYAYTGIVIIGLGVSVFSEAIGYSIATLATVLFMFSIRQLIEHDTESRKVYYEMSTWLIAIRVWTILSITFVLAGGSIIYGFLVLCITPVVGWRFLQRRTLDSKKSIYTKIDTIMELPNINPYRFGYYREMLKTEDEALDEFEDNLEKAKGELSGSTSEENKPLLEDVYHEVLVFEDEYNRYSETDDINAESVKSMSKSDLQELHSKMAEFSSTEDIPRQVQMAASEVERKIERAIEEWE